MTWRLFRSDIYGATWQATNPTALLIVKELHRAFAQGFAVELRRGDVGPRQVGAP